MTVPTTTNEKASKPEPVAKPKPKYKKALGLAQLQNGAGRDAKRTAAAILEVLGGARSPTDAAAALAVSLPRYYMLETRALSGLLQACEPRPVGRVRSAEHELTAARKQIEKLQRECARSQALVRVAQRPGGLAATHATQGGRRGQKAQAQAECACPQGRGRATIRRTRRSGGSVC